jgi:hypothetical protein
MNELLARIIDAHGGIDCWNRHEKVEATIVDVLRINYCQSDTARSAYRG